VAVKKSSLLMLRARNQKNTRLENGPQHHAPPPPVKKTPKTHHTCLELGFSTTCSNFTLFFSKKKGNPSASFQPRGICDDTTLP